MNAMKRYANTLRIASFTQDVATLYTELDGISAQKVCNIAVSLAGTVYAGARTGLFRYDPDAKRWFAVSLQGRNSEPVVNLFTDSEDSVIVATPSALFHLDRDEKLTTLDASGFIIVQAISSGKSGLLLLAPHALMDAAGKALAALPSGVTGQALAVLADGTPIIGTDQGLYRYVSGRLEQVPLQSADSNVPGRLTDLNVRALASDPYNGLWVATANSLYLYSASAWLDISTFACPPVSDIRQLALASDGSLWIATPRGAARLRNGSWRYFAGKRWLPSDHVNSLAIDADGTVWLATESGISKIEAVTLTLTDKAAHYEAITQARHNRDGYVTDCFLTRPGDLDSVLYHASDNDGLWTSLYICAESFRYAVTGEAEAKAFARQSMAALLNLVHVTGIPGFPARAIIRKGERVHQSDPGPNWYPSPVQPDALYKNDTSSDEIDGHYLAWYVYSELAADPDEKAQIAEVCRAVTDHLLDHNYTLVGPTGKRTRWGVWSPGTLNNDPEWAAERGLNSLAMLSHLKVAIHLCPSARYEEAYRALIAEYHYALNAITQKVLPPDGENNHSDDELAACVYYPLLQLETDPHLRALYLLGLERTQSILFKEHSLFHNVIYGACSCNACDVEISVQWLQDAPLDLRDWAMTNSHRRDVTLDKEPDRHGKVQLTHPLPPGERGVHRWNLNPYQADSDGTGGLEMDGTFWLLPYWMGRYHHIFEESNEQT